jgi:hypothetical protein
MAAEPDCAFSAFRRLRLDNAGSVPSLDGVHSGLTAIFARQVLHEGSDALVVLRHGAWRDCFVFGC